MPLSWAWIGRAFDADRFDTDDLGHRLLAALQMLTVGAMARNVHHGLGNGSRGFALAYGAHHALLVMLDVGAWLSVPRARPPTPAAAFGLLSAFVPPPWRFACWVVGFVVFGPPLPSRRDDASQTRAEAERGTAGPGKVGPRYR